MGSAGDIDRQPKNYDQRNHQNYWNEPKSEQK